MNKDQYEQESVLRALQRHDAIIESLEQALAVAHESRREFVNRHDLNRPTAFDHKKYCNHEWVEVPGSVSDEKYYEDYHWFCVICQKRVGQNEVMRRIDADGCSYVYIGKDDDQHAHMVD